MCVTNKSGVRYFRSNQTRLIIQSDIGLNVLKRAESIRHNQTRPFGDRMVGNSTVTVFRKMQFHYTDGSGLASLDTESNRSIKMTLQMATPLVRKWCRCCSQSWHQTSSCWCPVTTFDRRSRHDTTSRPLPSNCHQCCKRRQRRFPVIYVRKHFKYLNAPQLGKKPETTILKKCNEARGKAKFCRQGTEQIGRIGTDFSLE